jgi:cell wall-associated NlpC family hydrolase
MRTIGIHLPRDADMQARVGRLVSIRGGELPLRPGDLLFFASRRGTINHVAISLGGRSHIDAIDGGVAIRSLDDNTPVAQRRQQSFVFARRILADAEP